MEEALRQQNINRLQKKQLQSSDETATSSDSNVVQSETNNSSMDTAEPVSVPDVELVFKPYPGQGGHPSDVRYIKTTMNATGE